ncbi:MAG: hypothetical protein IIC51_02370 [Planctomycetes bacterium]|nr:hypothetical protein [Planctomycetota bacterium]
MSGISAGIGLISGIDRTSLIDQLMAIEARPVRILEARVRSVDVRRAAFLGLSAQIIALQSAARRFEQISAFRQFNSTSTNENILTADAGESAQQGVHSFRVHALATNHSVLSRGFHDADTTPIGVGVLTISEGQSRINRGTELNALNGGFGVGRGVITITDRAGGSADIDLTQAVTVQDILTAINGAESINIRARVTGVPLGAVTGDRIVIEDLTTDLDVTGNLVIADKGFTTTAADLGIVADTSERRVDGKDLIRLSLSTSLSHLNDGNGVGIARFGGDDLVIIKGGTTNESFNVSLGNLLTFETDLRALNNGAGVRLDGPSVIRLTDRSGASVDVDLSDLDLANGVNIQDVIDRIERETESGGVKISVAMVNSSLQILDATELEGENAGNLIVEDIAGFLAADLGILGDVADDDIQGRDIYRVSTIGDVINAINYAPGNNNAILQASLSADGKGIRLQALEFGSTVTVSAGENSSAAEDLGLLGAAATPDAAFESRRLVGGLNTVFLQSLRGGSGVSAGLIQLTDRGNRTTTIDFRDPGLMPATLQDVIDLINADENTSLVASVNAAGTGIEIRDESTDAGPGGFVVITDLEGGTMAADLGIARAFGEVDGGVVDGGHLHRRYVSTQTLLSDLNAGRGVPLGDFRITDSNGGIHIIQLSDNPLIGTVGSVIDLINRTAPASLEARLNDTGDGIMIIDRAGGSGPLTIEDIDGGQAAPGATETFDSSGVRTYSISVDGVGVNLTLAPETSTGIAGAVAMNDVRGGASASIGDTDVDGKGARIEITGGEVLVKAEEIAILTSTVESELVANATATKKSKTTSGSGTPKNQMNQTSSLAVSGIIATNLVQSDATATLVDSHVTTTGTTGDVRVEAINTSTLTATAVNAATVTGSNSSTAIGVTLAFNTVGYVSNNVLFNAIDALIGDDILSEAVVYGAASGSGSTASIVDSVVDASGRVVVEAVMVERRIKGVRSPTSTAYPRRRVRPTWGTLRSAPAGKNRTSDISWSTVRRILAPGPSIR